MILEQNFGKIWHTFAKIHKFAKILAAYFLFLTKNNQQDATTIYNMRNDIGNSQKILAHYKS
jgi:hypothetical protein